MMIVFLDTIVNAVNIWICYKFYCCFLDEKKEFSVRYRYTLAVIVLIVSEALNLIWDQSMVNTLITIAKAVVLMYLFYGSYGKKLSILSMYIIFTMLVEAGMVMMVSFMTDAKADDVIRASVDIKYSGNIIMELAEYFVVNSLIRYKNKDVYSVANQLYIELSLIPMVSIVLIAILINVELDSAGENRVIYYIVAAVIAFINIVQYRIFSRTEALCKEKYENDLTLQNMKYLEEYWKQVEQHQNEIRRIRHDMKNQFITIRSKLAENRDDVQILEIDDIMNTIADKESCCFTKNVSINAILNSKYKRMTEYDIDTDFQIQVPPELNILDMDLGVVIGNVLDNAIEAASKCEQQVRKIDLIISYFNHNLVLKCTNSCSCKVTSFFTTKCNQMYHGFGMSSIARVVHKYNGAMTYQTTNHSFCIQLNLWENKQ